MKENRKNLKRRIAAYIIDNLILVPIFALIHFAVFGTWIRHVPDFTLSFATHPVCLSFVVIYFAYFITFESVSGTTFGKLICKIKVVGEDGEKIGTWRAVMRNLLRLVDGIALYTVGIILILKSEQGQRLGDRLAGTVIERNI